MKKQYQLSEFQFYDGEEFITFNLIDINTEKKEITVAVTDRGRISVHTFDLLEDCGRLYFEYADASAFTHSTCWKIAAGSTSNTA